ncbi:MucBP domain-containing protein [Gordonibacter massiliensis (ex Traore et al. 2017)]|uniref:MucBP domain-containing protein n=1 Tax=Gordonibacter massiliensis (ex Traore et al. 2017) TaxID=1841863 RepID=UPI001C8B0E9A|nr:MucBP domain-containing protein [Gordonibacter massiliensis (ex Traore et al. 2017)]
MARVAAVVALACCLVAGGAYSAYAAWGDALNDEDYGWYYNGLDGGVYTLETSKDLYSFARMVNGTADTGNTGTYAPAHSFEGERVVLANDISVNTPITSHEFVPVGADAEHAFKGVFDGNGHKVLNLLISQRAESNTGLFGVVSSSGSIRNVGVFGAITIDASTYVENIGSVVGLCEGSISGCTSNVSLTVSSSFEPTEEAPRVAKNIGGVAGRITGSLSDSSFSGGLSMENDASAIIDGWDNTIPTVQNVGGVVGLFGEDELDAAVRASGGIDGCANSGTVYLSFTGEGGRDRFEQLRSSHPGCVGGIAGYSDGSISNCSNTGEIRTSTLGDSSTDGYGYDTTFNNGASQCGGIVGNLRAVVLEDKYSVKLTPDNGSKDDVLTVKNCYNTGKVFALASAGGIVGRAGTYTVITECSNGNYLDNNGKTGVFVDPEQGAVISTRWNKPFAGGIVGLTLGDVTFSYNRGQVNNTQSGFYLAGIAGGIGSDKLDTLEAIKNNDPDYKSEMHSCWNSGMIGLGHQASNKFGALVGSNDGYVHDCVVLEGCVIVGKDEVGSDAVGDAAWKQYRNINVLSLADLQTSDGLKVLNNYCASANGFKVYWYANKEKNDTYPVLNSWAAPTGQVELATINLEEKSVKDASFSTAADPVPTVSLVSGETELFQNVDYIIVPQAGARDITVNDEDNPRPYQYSVLGIGNYKGELVNFGHYGIGAGTLDDASVQASSPIFNWEVQFPESVQVLDAAGNAIDDSMYSYVIYDSMTNNTTSVLSPKYVVFDSEGTIQFLDGDGNPDGEPVPALDADTSHKAFRVYDRGGKLISDSDAQVYDPITGENVTGRVVDFHKDEQNGTNANITCGSSCINNKSAKKSQSYGNDGEAGYVLQVRGKESFAGSTQIGQYIIRPADLVRDCTVESIAYSGETWQFDKSTQKPYQEDGEGGRTEGMRVTFTGETIKPEMTITYLGKTLTAADFGSLSQAPTKGDYSYLYGPTDSSDGYPQEDKDEKNPNRNVTGDLGRAAVTARYDSLSHVDNLETAGACFTSYITCPFDIEPADFDACAVEVRDQALKEDGTVDAPVAVKLGDVTLENERDYTVSYQKADGTPLDGMPSEVGAYKAVVTPKSNLTGDPVTTGVFNVVEAQAFTLNDVANPTWDPVDVPLDLTFTGSDGQAVELKKGVDYDMEIYYWAQMGSDPTTGVKPEPKKTLISNDDGKADHLEPQSASTKIDWHVRVIGKGVYSGCEQDKAFKVNALDLSATDRSAWSVEGSASYLYLNTGQVSWDQLEPYKVTYQGVTMLDSTNMNIRYIGGLGTYGYAGVGKSFSWFVRGDNSMTTGKLELEQSGIAKPCSMLDDGIQPTTGSASLVYTGKEIKPVSAAFLAEGEDYEIAYYDNIDVGTARYAMTGKGNYVGTRTGSFAIVPADLSSFDVEVDDAIADGSKLRPAVTVTAPDGETILEKDKDYTVSYTSNIDPGTGFAWITGIGNYTGSASQSFKIGEPSVQKSSYTVSYVDEDGGKIADDKVVDDCEVGKEVEEAAQAVAGYELADPNSSPAKIVIDADASKNTITFVYRAVASGTDLSSAEIAPVKGQIVEVATKLGGAADVRALLAQRAGSGEPSLADDEIAWARGAKPPLSVSLAGRELAEGVDYVVEYSNNGNVTTAARGRALAVVKGVGSYRGEASVEFDVVGYAHHIMNADGSIVWETQKNWGADVGGQVYDDSDGGTVFYADGTPVKKAERTVDYDLLQAAPADGEFPDTPESSGTAGSTSLKPNAVVHLSTSDGRAEGWLGLNFAETVVSSKGLLAKAGAPSPAPKVVNVRSGSSFSDAVAAAVAACPPSVTLLPSYSPIWRAMGLDPDARLGEGYYDMGELAVPEAASEPAKYSFANKDGVKVMAALGVGDRLYGEMQALIDANPVLEGRLSLSEGLIGSPIASSSSVATSVVIPYDISSEGAYAALSEATRSAVANKAADGSLPSGVEVAFPEMVWDGAAVAAADLDPEVVDAFGNRLAKGSDYALSVLDASGAEVSEISGPGAYTAVLSGKVTAIRDTGLVEASSELGAYMGSATVPFEVKADPKYDLSLGAVVKVDDESYTGSALTPKITVLNSAQEQVDGANYHVAYYAKNVDGTPGDAIAPESLINVGEYVVVVTGAGMPDDPLSYIGSAQGSFAVKAVPFQVDDIDAVTYDGGRHIPSLTVRGIGTESVSLIEGKDYAATYLDEEKNIIPSFGGYCEAGTYWVRVEGVGNYSGSIDKSFTVERKDVSGMTAVAQAMGAYAGTPVEAAISIEGLVPGVDFEVVSYAGNAKAGMAIATIRGLGNYGGTIEASFKVQVDLSIARIEGVPDQEYIGKDKPVEPEFEVRVGEVILQKGVDYTVDYAGNIDPGVATATIVGSGEWYVGAKTVSFSIHEPILRDADTGITVSGTILADAKADGSTLLLEVSRIAEGDEAFVSTRQGYVPGDTELMLGYAITLKCVSPDGRVTLLKDDLNLTIAFPVDAAYDGRRVVVVMRHDDGDGAHSYETDTVIAENGVVSVKTDRLSEFFLAIAKASGDGSSAKGDGAVSEASGVSGSGVSSTLAPTGDGAYAIVGVAGLLCAIALCVLTYVERRWCKPRK